MEEVKKVYKTITPNWWQKSLQLYWMQNKAKLLDEFIYENGNITVKTLKGKTFSAPLSELKVRRGSNYFSLSHQGNKLSFVKMPYMPSNTEWEEITDILRNAGNYKQVIISKLIYIFILIIALLGFFFIQS